MKGFLFFFGFSFFLSLFLETQTLTRSSFLFLFFTFNLLHRHRYVEQYAADGKAAAALDAQEALGPIIKVALETSKLREFTGRDKPTVIT